MKLIGIVAPSSIIWLIILQFTFENRERAIQSPTESGMVGAMFLVPAIMVFLSLLTTSAGTIMIAETFVNKRITIGQAYMRVVELLFPLIGSLIIASVAITVGLMLWIPGLIVYAWFCLTPPVIMIEGEGGFGSLKRSRAIVKGHFVKAFLVVPLLAISQLLVVMVALLLPELSGNLFLLYSLSTFLAIFLPLLIEPLKIVTTTLLYYDLRSRKEGYDLELMSEELSQWANG